MATGIVRYFNDAKGFGLITPDAAGPALFAHAADVRGGKKIRAQQRVEFDVREDANGNCAANIRAVA